MTKQKTISLFSTKLSKQVRATEIDGTIYVSASDFAIRAGVLVNSVRNYYRRLPLSSRHLIRIDDPSTRKPLLMLNAEELKFFSSLIKKPESEDLYHEVLKRIERYHEKKLIKVTK